MDLYSATAQEVFDHVATHLIKQGRRAVNDAQGVVCAYRAHNGDKCAAGCLLDDERYDPGFEGKTWVSLARAGYVPSVHMELIGRLQIVHDGTPVEDWKSALISIANQYGLVYPEALLAA